jgi:RNA-directed DNA polymerase
MSFWKKVARFFGIPAPYETEVLAAMGRRLRRRRTFTRSQIAKAALASRDGASREGADDEARAAVLATIDELFERGVLARHGYTRSRSGRDFIFHPEDEPPDDLDEEPAEDDEEAEETARPARTHEAGVNPYDAGDLMTLSPRELRARALKVSPWSSEWTWRMDIIPPQSDERTALVDRALVLRGYLEEEEIAEIHRVGDEWLLHRDGARLARAKAAQSADAAVEALRAERAAAKAEKRRVAAERKQKRAEEIAQRRRNDIVFLGRGVSWGLADRRANVELLEKTGLPVLATPRDLAEAMGLGVPTLRWLAFHDDAPQRIHYVQFEVPKRSGGTRLLSAPMPRLAAAQRWVLDHLLAKLPLEDAAHGFVSRRSTVTAARPHVGRDVVLNVDIEDFFPTITFPRVRGVFTSLGYSPAVATILALLCTEAPRRVLSYDGVAHHVAVGPRGLPQGASTSPALSNLVARKLDRRLQGLARTRGFAYTRYADDLTFSAPTGHRDEIARLLASVRHILEEEGFAVQLKKGRVQRRGGRQIVTGIVVNERLSVPREEIRRLRAILHNAKRTGLAAQNREGHPAFEAHLRGKIAYVSMIDPTRGARLRAELETLAGN